MSGEASLFRRTEYDVGRYEQLLASMQRLRGRVYVKDGALQPHELTSDGRHIEAADRTSWHMLCLDENDDSRVVACARWLQHTRDVAYHHLHVRHAPIASCDTWGHRFRSAVEAELESARSESFSYIELGGWALDEKVRGTSEALRSAVATFAWTRLIGGALAIGTVTRRNGSADILTRMGGQRLQSDGAEVPSCFDPRYNCEMEVLRFDSRLANPRYEDAITDVQSQMALAPVISGSRMKAAAFAAAA